jgi:opacity protein-like surface antigen
MRLKAYANLTLAVLFVCAASSVFAQAVLSGRENRIPLSFGGGIAGYKPDIDHGHLLGPTLWFDYLPNQLPHWMRGFGIEAEAHDLNYIRSDSEPPDLRQDYAGGGPIYSWPHYKNYRPYVKYDFGFGNTDNETVGGHRFHDTRTINAYGGGLDIRTTKNVWLRVDYEYQVWPNYFKATLPHGVLNPRGITIGAMYHFHLLRSQ